MTGTKTVYKNPWISVREDEVIRPDGKPGIFGVVTMKAGVTVLPVDNKGKVYLTREFHYGIGRITAEAISGGIYSGEDKLAAAKRELEEETGLKAARWQYLDWIDPFTTAVVSPNYLYLACGLTEGQSHPEGTETIRVIKVPYEKALEMVEEGEITHSATVVLLLKAKDILGK
ncbi:MAG: Pyrophosphohydrolase related protein [Candidatus Amesbacteria bacterium GW2011_GWB1_47_19]|nr:MAG: Pyrophosphohydrolase related protein [Candidatus Amesbacteria bacterium GW2011_GWA1_44_24]KKU31939.1 MAG: NUDIX hydrolase [Candidatus Amesbacteria bacterium GW2011_GWC1_46_24]KKU66875.1 MAG: Pyrophosphohydrolase related protein [Candidatus Amesbacteria bacterium GW2011_GWB1_47_19]